nr:alpha/beta hydrolase fold-3 domain protein [uncultured bacterium]
MRARQREGRRLPRADVTDLSLPVGPSGAVGVRVLRTTRGRGVPAVVYLHGGGWVMGDRRTHDRAARGLATASDAAVVLVDYTRAPEARFLTALLAARRQGPG